MINDKWSRFFFPLIALLLAATTMPALAVEGEGQWVPKKTVTKFFNTWQTKISSNAPVMRFYAPGDDTRHKYYDNIRAVISLKSLQEGVYSDAGNLVFFSDTERTLPADRNEADGTVTLFYRYKDYLTVLNSLAVNQTGTVEWTYFEQQSSRGPIRGYVSGQINFSPVD